ncbi:MAG TPA: kelch repeat-containing protein [Planctomycetota bacterium]|nr:kelch repeat-containing protein [Planctomycetota bacterium]
MGMPFLLPAHCSVGAGGLVTSNAVRCVVSSFQQGLPGLTGLRRAAPTPMIERGVGALPEVTSMKLAFRGVATVAVVGLMPLAPAQTGIWTNSQPSTSPPVRTMEGLAFERVSGLFLAYGGTPDPSGYTPYADTWAFDGCSWFSLAPGTNPGTRFNVDLAPSPTPGRVVLFGGVVVVIPGIPPAYTPVIDGTTWEFDALTTTWTNVSPAGASPSARQLATLAYDSFRGRTVLFGGTDGYGAVFHGDTWEWDGTSWANVTPVGGPSPSARAWHAMTFDATRRRTVLFGGYDGFAQHDDTWEWDGTQWTRIPTPVSPSPRSSVAMAYDSWTQRVVLFAGSQGWPTGWNDTWEYDGTTWYPVSILGTIPPPQYLHRMVGDPVRGGILLHGAFGSGWSPLNDTWRYQRAALTATSLHPAPGATVSYLLTLPQDPGLPYIAAISLSGTCPGLALPDGRIVSLNPDAFTSISLSGAFPSTFQGFVGTLNAGGAALLALAIPPIPALSGLAVSTAAVTWNGVGFRGVTNATTFVIQ